jgi:zinc transport system substrate-binding protein
MNCNKGETNMKKKLLFLFCVMASVALAGALIINLFSSKTGNETAQGQDKLHVVATFYPVYLIGLNLAGGSDGIEVKSLTDLNTGCLHDYQLTTEDMKMISNADVLVVNGGGMEGFLADVRANYPKLRIIDASEGITMLKEENTSIVASEDSYKTLSTDETVGNTTTTETYGSGAKASSETASDIITDTNYNAHVWLDPERYIKQIENVRDGLIEYINTSSDFSFSSSVLENEITGNAQGYINEVQRLDQEFKETFADSAKQDADEAKAVIFHDSFAYLANKAGITVAFSVPLDSDTSLSAGDIATIIDAVRKDNIKYLFTELQYSDSIAKQIEEETGAKVYIINSVVTGSEDEDSYLKAMRSNLDVIKEAVGQ